MEVRTESWIMGMLAAGLMSFMGTKTPWSQPSMYVSALKYLARNVGKKLTAFLIQLRLKPRSSQQISDLLRDLWTSRRVIFDVISFCRKSTIVIQKTWLFPAGDSRDSFTPMGSDKDDCLWSCFGTQTQDFREFVRHRGNEIFMTRIIEKGHRTTTVAY